MAYEQMTGTLAAPSPVRFGDLITVRWDVSAPGYRSLTAYLCGPGFSEIEQVSLVGARQVRAVTTGGTIAWTLYAVDPDADRDGWEQVATTTTTVL